MKKFTAYNYYSKSGGLKITDESNALSITITGDSSKEIEETASKILALLNQEYYEKRALLKDNQENYDLGLITNEERLTKESQILS